MKKFVLMALAGSLVLAGCASTPLDDKRTMVVEGKKMEVQVQNIRSFEVEIAPRKAVCQIADITGKPVESECLQYRRTYERNFNTLAGGIEGFEYETGHRYVLDVKQTALLNEVTGEVVPVWSLNKIVSKTVE